MEFTTNTINKLNISSKLSFFGGASLAKSIIFRTLAHHSHNNKDLISATISGYYCLFHLTIALMYICHQILVPEQLNKLMKIINTNGSDPTKEITHNNAKYFLKRCIDKNLDKKCIDTFDLGKKLREYVNYGPRMSLINDMPIFGDCAIVPQNLNDFISTIDDCIIKAIQWSNNNSTIDKISFIKIAINHVRQFFYEKELFYLEWCNKNIITDARSFYKRLKRKFEK